MKSATIKLWQNTLNLLMPPCCVACKRATQHDFLCEKCLQKIKRPPCACQCCGLALHEPAKRCGQCLQQPPYFNKLYCLGDFTAPLSTLVQQLKFNDHFASGQALSVEFIKRLRQDYAIDSLPSLLIPVPLHRKRLGKRGFNQSLELAKPLARHFKININAHACKRIKATPAQTQLNLAARQQNLKNAFTCIKPLTAKHIAIVDDVVTTTATVNNLAKCLRQFCEQRIDIWCISRTQR